MTEPGIEAGLLLSGSLEIPWFPGSAIRFFYLGAAAVYKAFTYTLKNYIQDRRTEETEGEGAKPVSGCLLPSCNLTALVLESSQTLGAAGWVSKNRLCGW